MSIENEEIEEIEVGLQKIKHFFILCGFWAIIFIFILVVYILAMDSRRMKKNYDVIKQDYYYMKDKVDMLEDIVKFQPMIYPR